MEWHYSTKFEKYEKTEECSMKGNGAGERLGQIEENIMCLTKIPGSLGISI